jgi:hypothetical protein
MYSRAHRNRLWRRATAKAHRNHRRKSDRRIRRSERRPAPDHLRYLGRALDALQLQHWT